MTSEKDMKRDYTPENFDQARRLLGAGEGAWAQQAYEVVLREADRYDDEAATGDVSYPRRPAMSDIDTIRERHKGDTHVCAYWLRSDPNDTRCDTRVVLDALDASETAPYIAMYDGAMRDLKEATASAAADLALAAAVRELEDITEMSYDPSLRRGQWDVRINDHVGVGDTLTAAIKAAKEASDE